MKLFLLALLSVPGLAEDWEQYKMAFGKTYPPGEDKRRKEQFIETLNKIEEHNKNYGEGKFHFSMTVNEFTDWFPEELRLLTTLKPSYAVGKKFELGPTAKIPKEMNWGEKGAVTPVKHQGRCGAGYAFAAAAALEALMFRQKKEVADLSVQELMDCTYIKNRGDKGGCNEATLQDAFYYVKKKGGLSDAGAYPYTGRWQNCTAGKKDIAVNSEDYISTLTEKQLEAVVGTLGPVASGMRISHEVLYYEYGVYDGPCLAGMNHAMLVVGYGYDSYLEKDYWLLKNSWGEQWGEGGFMRVVKGNNKCKIGSYSIIPI